MEEEDSTSPLEHFHSLKYCRSLDEALADIRDKRDRTLHVSRTWERRFRRDVATKDGTAGGRPSPAGRPPLGTIKVGVGASVAEVPRERRGPLTVGCRGSISIPRTAGVGAFRPFP
jgi:hypothetical protein